MTLFDKIKILLKLNTAAIKIKEAYKMDTTNVKPGWKTTEFWGKVAIQVFTLYGSVKGFLPVDKAALITALLEGVYSIGRAVVKFKGGSLPDVPAAS